MDAVFAAKIDSTPVMPDNAIDLVMCRCIMKMCRVSAGMNVALAESASAQDGDVRGGDQCNSSRENDRTRDVCGADQTGRRDEQGAAGEADGGIRRNSKISRPPMGPRLERGVV